MLFKAGVHFSDFTDAGGNGTVAGCQRSNTIGRAVTVLGLEKDRAYTRGTLGCNNVALPEYLKALSAAGIDDGSHTQDHAGANLTSPRKEGARAS